MIKRINVIDLDYTLLPYNSLTRFVLLFMIKWRLFLPILLLSFFRIMGLLGRDKFQKRILILTRKTPNYESRLQEFAQMLYRDINSNIMRFVNENTDKNTLNVLCTSSPEDYVKYLCKKMKDWRCICSTLDEHSGLFYHMYGPNKVKSITEVYPPDSYFYYVALSDSKTDLDLLKLFNKAFIIKKNKFIKLDRIS